MLQCGGSTQDLLVCFSVYDDKKRPNLIEDYYLNVAFCDSSVWYKGLVYPLYKQSANIIITVTQESVGDIPVYQSIQKYCRYDSPLSM